MRSAKEVWFLESKPGEITSTEAVILSFFICESCELLR